MLDPFLVLNIPFMAFLAVIFLCSTLVTILPPASGEPKHFLIETVDGSGGTADAKARDYWGDERPPPPPPPTSGWGERTTAAPPPTTTAPPPTTTTPPPTTTTPPPTTTTPPPTTTTPLPQGGGWGER